MRRPLRRTAALLAFLPLSLAAAGIASAQDNILIYGNSITRARTPLYLSDLVEQAGGPAPNIETYIFGDKNTSDYLANQGLISSRLPAGETWKAVIVQGGTLETTTLFGFDPAVFESNMVALAGAFFAHSPQGLFIGHETGADHPDSARYPAWFPDAATWLGFSQVAYENARQQIAAAYPSNPAPRTAPQGTVFADTAGYPLGLFDPDLHHFRRNGQILCALLHYQAIYGGQLCDLDVDYGVSTPLVDRLIADNVSEALWKRLVGWADRSLPAGQRPYPGSSEDFQLRVVVGSGLNHTCTYDDAMPGDTLSLEAFSPLDSADHLPAAIFVELLPAGGLPPAAGVPAWHLNPSSQRIYANLPDLSGGAVTTTIPAAVSGLTYFTQAVSRMPSSAAGFVYATSDAKVIHIQ